MPISKPDRMSKWKFHRLTAEEKTAIHDMKMLFNAAARGLEFSQDALNNLEIEVVKASVKLTKEELADGVFHRFRDGQPFYRIRVAAKQETDETRKIVGVLINWYPADKWIKAKPKYGIEFDVREYLRDVAFKMAAAMTREAPIVHRYASYLNPKP